MRSGSARTLRNSLRCFSSPHFRFVRSQAILTCGQAVSGSISQPGQTRSYTLTVAAGDVVRINQQTTAGMLRPWLELFDPTGTRVANNWWIEQQLNAPGTYVLLVRDTDQNRTGTYALRWLGPAPDARLFAHAGHAGSRADRPFPDYRSDHRHRDAVRRRGPARLPECRCGNQGRRRYDSQERSTLHDCYSWRAYL